MFRPSHCERDGVSTESRRRSFDNSLADWLHFSRSCIHLLPLRKTAGILGLDIHAAAGDRVPKFVRVNNRMSGIVREPTQACDDAARQGCGRLTPRALDGLLADVFQPRQVVDAGSADDAKHGTRHDCSQVSYYGYFDYTAAQ